MTARHATRVSRLCGHAEQRDAGERLFPKVPCGSHDACQDLKWSRQSSGSTGTNTDKVKMCLANS